MFVIDINAGRGSFLAGRRFGGGVDVICLRDINFKGLVGEIVTNDMHILMLESAMMHSHWNPHPQIQGRLVHSWILEISAESLLLRETN